MQGRILDGLQRCQHGFLVPDGAFLDIDLGGITGQRNLVDQVPFHRIGKGGLEQGVDFVNRGAGQQPLLLLRKGFASHRAHIAHRGSWQGWHRTSQCRRCAAPVPSVSRYTARSGSAPSPRTGCRSWGPFVLGGLDRDPLVQHFLHRHGVGDEERAVQQFFLDRDLSLLRLLPGLETFPSLAGFAGMVFVLVTDGVGISAGCTQRGEKSPKVGQSPPPGKQAVRAWLLWSGQKIQWQGFWTLSL